MLLRFLKIKLNVKLVFKVQKQSFAYVLQNRRSQKCRKFHRKTLVLEALLNKNAGPQALLKRDSGKGCKIFKNTLMVASENLRNILAEQMFTRKLNNIVPRAILKKKIAFFLSPKNAQRTRLATKIMFSSNLFSCLFFCYWHGKYVLDTP